MDPEAEPQQTESTEDLVARSTLSDSVQISVNGQFNSESDAQELWGAIFAILKLGGAYLELQGLAGVSVDDDYLTALAAVDRGFENQPTVQPTSDEFGNGFAMTLPVRRNGVMKSHIVLDSRLCRPLVDPEGPAYKFAVHTLLHEAAHVHDHQIQYQSFPGFYGSVIDSFCENLLVKFALSAWDEYIASRLSAPWGIPDYVTSFEDGLVQMLATARQRGNAAVAEHNQQSDIRKTAEVIASAYGSVLTRASYVLGHVEGLGTDLAVEAPQWNQAIEGTPWFCPFWAHYRTVLNTMYQRYGQWENVEVLNPLKTLFQHYFLTCGMLVQTGQDGSCSVYFKQI